MNEQLFFSDSTSLYFYSALFQGNAALITLTSMFLIYKKQSLDTEFNTLENRFLNFFTKSHGIDLFIGNIFDIRNYVEATYFGLPADKVARIKLFLEGHAWQSRITQLDEIDKQRKNLWASSKAAVILLFLVLILSVAILPFSSTINKNFGLEILLFAGFIFVQSLGLILLIKFIINQSK